MTESRRERKVVTVLFADLVGFTARAETLDPEDVEAILGPYHERLRAELERHGGTVEKFIGDAVMALFGAPVAHEDDPERAVRAALAIRDWVAEEGGIEVRIGVATGEALVRLGARPSEGEGMASGDVVNTAARLQSAAPVNGIVVGEQTFRATRDQIEYRDHPPVEAKGKSEPVAVWEVVEARSRFGIDVEVRTWAPLVGRAEEIDLLRDALARARREGAPQLVTLVGVPGMGKTRLVRELFGSIEAEPDFTVWRQGRSLPYGEGASFWALAEMVKAQAGILVTDLAEQAEAKLAAAMVELVADEAERAWIEGHVRPLVGLGGENGSSGERHEAFAAWLRLLEALAERHPAVLVFEDLHWADDGLLDFVDHLAERATGVPLLVVCTARPELLDRRPGWGGGKRNATTVSLAPLTDEETARLVAALFHQPVIAAETQQALLARAGGNPLYAEQFVRMLAERQDIDELPESVQGIIAARLDALSAEEKALLQDAAVVGKVFWLGSLGAISGVERRNAEERLHALERKEFVQRARRPSVAGESEYAFAHLLVRDVAYGQIPRALRAEKHRLAAEWIASLTSDRAEDRAEMLAHHYRSALEFARAAGQETAPLELPARNALRDAGDRAKALGALGTAARHYTEAIALTPAGDPERPYLRFRLGQVRADDASLDPEIVAGAAKELLAAGDSQTAAEAEVLTAFVWWTRGQRDQAFAHLERALDLVEGAPVSRSLAYVVCNVSRYYMLADETEEAIRLGREGLRMAEELGLDELRAHALNNIGVSRVNGGDRGGLDDLKRCIEIARTTNSPELVRGLQNLASVVSTLGDMRQAIELHTDSIEAAERFGRSAMVEWIQVELAIDLYFAGRWAEALPVLDAFIHGTETGSPSYMEVGARTTRAHIRLAHDDPASACKDSALALERSRIAKDPQVIEGALAIHARVLETLGRDAEAADRLGELLDLWRERAPGWPPAVLTAAWCAVRLGQGEELGAVLPAGGLSLWIEAGRKVVSGDFLGAAEVCERIGTLPDEAYARLRAAEELIAAGRRPEADVQLAQALAFYRSVDATAYIREGEALLAATG